MTTSTAQTSAISDDSKRPSRAAGRARGGVLRPITGKDEVTPGGATGQDQRRVRQVNTRPPRIRVASKPTWKAPGSGQTWCEANSEVFLTVLSSPPSKKASTQEQVTYENSVALARDCCQKTCPQFSECLERALTSPGVEGFVAGTTELERDRLRQALAITPEAYNGDHAAGVQPKVGAAFDVDATRAIIAAHPSAPDTEIAERLGISAVTVKRHRKKIREAQQQEQEQSQEAPAEPVRTPEATRSLDFAAAYRSEMRFTRTLEEVRWWVRRNGTALVPLGARGRLGPDGIKFPLGDEVKDLRRLYRQGRLDVDVASAFEALPGWDWDPVDSRWKNRFATVLDHYNECEMTSADREWLAAQRERGDSLRPEWQRMLDEHTELLPSIPSRVAGFVEASKRWLTQNPGATMADLRQHMVVDVDGVEVGIGLRAKDYRRQYHGKFEGNPLSADEVAAIESLPGWTWDPLGSVWRAKFDEVETSFKQGRLTADHHRWLTRQRERFDQLRPEWVSLLERHPGLLAPAEKSRVTQFVEAARQWLAEHPGSTMADMKNRDRMNLNGVDFAVGKRGTYYRRRYHGLEGRGPLTSDEITAIAALPGWSWQMGDRQRSHVQQPTTRATEAA